MFSTTRLNLDEDFKPAWFLNNGHLQTIWASKCRYVKSPAVVRERLATADGDFVDLDWCGKSAGPIVILLHGLAGNAQSAYIKGMQMALFKMGWRSVALNFRGCSDQPNHKARNYHSGDCGDIHHLYLTLRNREPETSIAAVGYSLGGNVLLKWLAEFANDISLFAAAAISVPFQLDVLASHLDRGFARIYRDALIGELKQGLSIKLDYLLRNGFDDEAQKLRILGDLSTVRSFWEFDQRVTATLFQFKDVDDYYQRSSSRQYLHKIKTPTCIIQSVDDPFMSPEVIPSANELSSSITLKVTQSGGHVGFVSGKLFAKVDYWLERYVPRYLKQAVLK